MAQIIKTSGEVIEIEPKNGTDFQLEELQAIVSGYIEIYSLANNNIMVINEEGKIHHLGINHEATKLFHECYGGWDVIVGDVLICKSDEVK